MSNMSQKRATGVWTQEEELTLVGGLKRLCANDWKEDNGTFKDGYLMELEQHMNDGATEQFAEGPEVGVEEIERIEAQEVTN
ncbi:hypothetical protein KY285_032804 [Solanum tuberosum]|nr:hypothetical protein KY285_032804 [Solanum tuberosum]